MPALAPLIASGVGAVGAALPAVATGAATAGASSLINQAIGRTSQAEQKAQYDATTRKQRLKNLFAQSATTPQLPQYGIGAYEQPDYISSILSEIMQPRTTYQLPMEAWTKTIGNYQGGF